MGCRLPLNARRLQSESTPTSGLALSAKLVSERYCTGDNETFTYRVEIEATVSNQTGRRLVIPLHARAISRVFLAKDVEGLRRGKLEADMSLTFMFSGGRALTAGSFVEVPDGDAHQFAGTIRTVIPTALVPGQPLGLPTTGPHEMSIVLDLWTGSDKEADRWRRHFGRSLWTDSLVSQPLHVVIPDRPTVADCN